MSEMSPLFKFFSILLVSLVSVNSLVYGLDGIEMIDVGGKPVSSIFAYSKLYINNEQDNNVTVLDTNTHKILKKIEVGKKPISSILVGKNIYVNNLGDNFISVIDGLTNLVTKTILVEAFPNFSRHASAKLYVTNSGSDTVSIINTTTESWLKNIKLGQSVTQPSAVFVTWGRVLVLNL